MSLVIRETPMHLWHDTIKQAENRCSISLKEEVEYYLVSLLMRYTHQPELIKQIFATAFLEAVKRRENERKQSLQCVGDQCLLFAGLFPRVAEKRHVKLSYFVNMGRKAYIAISHKANDLYGSLAIQFVALMDVLQSIPSTSDLLPLEAYEQWNELGSQRALQILQAYTRGIPLKRGP